MELPYTVDTLDDVPEEARPLYQEEDGRFRLPVTGVKTEEEVKGLEGALAKVKQREKEAREKAGSFSEEDREELAKYRAEREKLEEERAKQEGRWEELRTKYAKEFETKLSDKDKALAERDAVIENLTVTNALRSAIAESGIKPEYHEAVEALLSRRGPKVEWDADGKPVGVFPDELHGPKPIAEYVAEWARSDVAQHYLPPANDGGGGARGAKDTGAGTKKAFGEMDDDEKNDLIDALVEKHGPNWQAEYSKIVASAAA